MLDASFSSLSQAKNTVQKNAREVLVCCEKPVLLGCAAGADELLVLGGDPAQGLLWIAIFDLAGHAGENLGRAAFIHHGDLLLGDNRLIDKEGNGNEQDAAQHAEKKAEALIQPAKC